MKIGRTEYAGEIQFYSAGYERVMVPGVFAVWAKDLLETAALAPGMRRWMWLVALVLLPV